MKVAYKINGKPATAEQFRRHKLKLLPVSAGGGRRLLPMSHNAIEGYSIACSLPSPTPDQIQAENEFCRVNGISGVHFDPSHKHNCRVTDNKGFAKYLKLVGRENVDGGHNGY